MLETITRCSICKREDCDGKKWLLEYHEPHLGQSVSRIICSINTNLKDGKRYTAVTWDDGHRDAIEVREV